MPFGKKTRCNFYIHVETITNGRGGGRIELTISNISAGQNKWSSTPTNHVEPYADLNRLTGLAVDDIGK
jgi:hypothetical protein